MGLLEEEPPGPGRKEADDESGWILGAPRPEGWVSKSGSRFVSRWVGMMLKKKKIYRELTGAVEFKVLLEVGMAEVAL